MEFLTLEQLRECVVEIRAAFNALMENQTLAVRKDARQWRFFRSCLERTLAALPGTWSADRVHWPSVTGAALAAIPGRWPMHPPQQLAQFKFEVEDKLRRFYLRHSGPIDFVFSLVHRRDAVRDRLIVDPRYPQCG